MNTLGLSSSFILMSMNPSMFTREKGNLKVRPEILMQGGLIKEIILTNVKGRKPLKGSDLKNLKEFLEIYAESIVSKWVDYFVYNREISFEKITQKL